jgi:hypothetical protein
MSRKYPAVDKNQAEIVRELEKMSQMNRDLGDPSNAISIVNLSRVGSGVPDLLIGYRGWNYLIEIKNPKQPERFRKLTPEQEKFHNDYCGHATVAETVEEIVSEIGYKGPRVLKR